MPNIEDLRKTRIEKMEALKGAGNNPFPNSVKRECTIKEALDNFWIWRLTNKTVFLTGRIQSIREHGQIIFFDLKDGGGKIQCFLHHEKMTAFFDIGDFVEVGGAVFKTKQKEKTLRVKKIRIIAKTIRPLPEKWHGLKDVEERYRKRYLDLLMNPEIKEQKALWGLSQRLITNLVTGVTEGFTRQLEINGVGYRAEVKGDKLILSVGYSFPKEYLIPAGVEVKVEKNIITLFSIDKQLIGQSAAEIRKVRKPEPYKGKGVRYEGEKVIKKAGKAAKTAGA